MGRGRRIPYNVAYAIFGGLTPLIVTSLLAVHPMAHAWYLLFIAALTSGLGLYLTANSGRVEASAGIEETATRSQG